MLPQQERYCMSRSLRHPEEALGFTGSDYDRAVNVVHQFSIGDPAFTLEDAINSMNQALEMSAKIKKSLIGGGMSILHLYGFAFSEEQQEEFRNYYRNLVSQQEQTIFGSR